MELSLLRTSLHVPLDLTINYPHPNLPNPPSPRKPWEVPLASCAGLLSQQCQGSPFQYWSHGDKQSIK